MKKLFNWLADAVHFCLFMVLAVPTMLLFFAVLGLGWLALSCESDRNQS